MIVAVADTHAALWYIYSDDRLSRSARALLDHAAAEGYKVAISSISLAELVYLCEKGRVGEDAYRDLRGLLSDTGGLFVEAPVDRNVTDSMHRIPRSSVPDMPDRIVAATGLHLAVPVISRDGKIRSANLLTVW